MYGFLSDLVLSFPSSSIDIFSVHSHRSNRDIFSEENHNYLTGKSSPPLTAEGKHKDCVGIMCTFIISMYTRLLGHYIVNKESVCPVPDTTAEV